VLKICDRGIDDAFHRARIDESRDERTEAHDAPCHSVACRAAPCADIATAARITMAFGSHAATDGGSTPPWPAIA
jgi:hypothetical protein